MVLPLYTVSLSGPAETNCLAPSRSCDRHGCIGLLEAFVRSGRFVHGPLLATNFPSIIQAM